MIRTLLLALLVLSPVCWAQRTNVTALVSDVNGGKYVNCSYQVDFAPNPLQTNPYTYGGSTTWQQHFPNGHCDGFGNLSIPLLDNLNSLSPTDGQWKFTICSATGYVPGNQFCFFATITITGASQNISSTLTPLAPILPAFSGGGTITGATPNGGLVQTGTTLGMLTSCGSNQILSWNTTAWVCANNGPTLPPPVFPPHSTILITVGTQAPQVLGIASGNAPYHAGTSNPTIIPTAVNPAGTHFTSSTTASTTEAIYISLGNSGSQSGLFGLLAFNYFATRLSLQALTNCRYYWGLNTWGTGSTLGTNSQQVGGSSKFATDTPNSSTIGFRYSNGTDTNFKALTINPGASPASTVVDTGVVADTAVHLFEIYPNATSTAMLFYIDKNLVANISTNLPVVPPGNSIDAFANMFLSGDNKNTATSVAMDFYSMEIAIRIP